MARKNTAAEAPAGTRVRILADVSVEGVAYKPNHVVDLPPAVAAALVKEGVADDADAGIAYCQGELGIEPVAHRAIAPSAAE